MQIRRHAHNLKRLICPAGIKHSLHRKVNLCFTQLLKISLTKQILPYFKLTGNVLNFTMTAA